MRYLGGALVTIAVMAADFAHDAGFVQLSERDGTGWTIAATAAFVLFFIVFVFRDLEE